MPAERLTNAWQPDDPTIPPVLRDATIEETRPVYHSSNSVFIARLSHPERGEGLGVYKPERGEQPLWDFPDGLYHREVAAYELAVLLGWPIIPPTVECDGPYGPGSLQLFVEHDPREHFFELRERDTFDWPLVRLAVFDLIANNADRKGGHVLLDPRGHLWGIDNGLCFHEQQKLRTVIWDYAGTEVPPEWCDDIRRLRDALRQRDVVAAPLLARLADAECAALADRCDALLERPVLPEMYPWRCVPWPLI